MNSNCNVIRLYNEGKFSYAVLLALSLVPNEKYVSRLYFFRIMEREPKNDQQLRNVLLYCFEQKFILKKRLSNYKWDNGYLEFMKNSVYGPINVKGRNQIWDFFKITEDGLKRLLSFKKEEALFIFKKRSKKMKRKTNGNNNDDVFKKINKSLVVSKRIGRLLGKAPVYLLGLNEIMLYCLNEKRIKTVGKLIKTLQKNNLQNTNVTEQDLKVIRKRLKFYGLIV